MDVVDQNESGLIARRTPARVGVCALNLLQPGLGLVRVGKMRAGLLFLGGGVVCGLAAVAALTLGGELSYPRFLFVIGLALLALVGLYGGSIFQTWRFSRYCASVPSFASRWYAIVAFWFILAAINYPLPDVLRAHYRPFYVPSVSFEPTLQTNDRFFAKMFNFEPLQRGDVVIVAAPNGTEYVKRLAGLPGDRFAMEKGVVIVNGQSAVLQQVGKQTIDTPTGREATWLRVERLPGEARTHRIYSSGTGPSDNWPETLLGPDEYFLLGDNRDHSADSRHSPDFGGLDLVHKSAIRGRALFRYWRTGEGLGGNGL